MDIGIQEAKTEMRHVTDYPSQAKLKGGEEAGTAQQYIPGGTAEGNWSYNRWLHQYEDKKVADGIKKKRLALTWTNLEVTGVDSRAVFGQNVLSLVNPFELVRNSKSSGTVVSWPHIMNTGKMVNVFTMAEYYTQTQRTVETRGDGMSLTPL
jgi:hypothetical protein